MKEGSKENDKDSERKRGQEEKRESIPLEYLDSGEGTRNN